MYSVSDRKLSKENGQAEQINKEFGRQNVALSRDNFELEKKSKLLQDENNSLVRNNADLKREGDKLTHENGVLLGVNNDLLAAIEVGVIGEFYSKKIPQMFDTKQKQFFFSAYFTVLFGKRK